MSARRIHRRLTIEELEPRIALGVADIAVVNVQNAPAALGPGDHATVKLVLDNRGDAPTGPFEVQWYLSEQPGGPTNTSVPLATQAVPNGIQAGQSVTMNEPLTMPSSGPVLQKQYYIVAVADSAHVVSESNLANNVGHSTPAVWGISQAQTNALTYAVGTCGFASYTQSIKVISGQLGGLDFSCSDSISISLSGNGAVGLTSSPLVDRGAQASPAQGATGGGSFQVAAGGTSPSATSTVAQSAPTVDRAAMDGIPIVIAPADRSKFAPAPFIPPDISPPAGVVQNGAANPANNVSSTAPVPKPGSRPSAAAAPATGPAPSSEATVTPATSRGNQSAAALLQIKPTATGIIPASISLPAAQTPVPRSARHTSETEDSKSDSAPVSRAPSYAIPILNTDGYDWLMPVVEKSLK